MKIRESVRPDLIFLGLEAPDAETAIEVVADRVARARDMNAETVADALAEREKLGSTSVGGGFAIPHCKLDGIDEIVVALARFEAGVDFGGNHHGPVSFFFVVLSPPDRPAEHLQILSQIARVLKNEDLRTALGDAGDREAVVEAIRRAVEAEGL